MLENAVQKPASTDLRGVLSDREIHAPPPQNRRSTSRVQNWGWCGFSLFLRFRQFAPPPPKYHLMRKVCCGDGAWFPVPIYCVSVKGCTKVNNNRLTGSLPLVTPLVLACSGLSQHQRKGNNNNSKRHPMQHLSSLVLSRFCIVK